MMLHGTWPKDGVRRVGTAKESDESAKVSKIGTKFDDKFYLINIDKPW